MGISSGWGSDMGLDQYWYRETYEVAPLDGYPAPTTHDGLPIPRENLGVITSSTSTDQVGYLRKANAVHGWIVNNLAEGKDECQRIYMDAEDVKRLRADVRIALDTGTGMEPVSGFFFGSQEKDEYWREDLRRTEAICDWLLADIARGQSRVSYFYQASW